MVRRYAKIICFGSSKIYSIDIVNKAKNYEKSAFRCIKEKIYR